YYKYKKEKTTQSQFKGPWEVGIILWLHAFVGIPGDKNDIIIAQHDFLKYDVMLFVLASNVSTISPMFCYYSCNLSLCPVKEEGLVVDGDREEGSPTQFLFLCDLLLGLLA
ncbi:hypothetical protein ACJX0J_032303, partial [Zea mays]